MFLRFALLVLLQLGIPVLGDYRYDLEVKWDNGPMALVIGCNPSSVDTPPEEHRTIQKIKSILRWNNFAGFYMANLYAFKAVDPSDMKQVANQNGLPYVIGNPQNDRMMISRLQQSNVSSVVFAYGGICVKNWQRLQRQAEDRAMYVRNLIRQNNIRPARPVGAFRLSRTRPVYPHHPLSLHVAWQGPLVPWPDY